MRTRPRPSPLTVCLLAALALHGGVGLTMLAQARHDAVRTASASASTSTMQVRWLHHAATTAMASAMPELTAHSMADTHTAPPASTAPPVDDTLASAAPDLAPAIQPTPAATPDDPSPQPGTAERPYLSRAEVEQGPAPLGLVQIPYPEGVTPGRVYSGRLTLFIDEQGVVRKVVAQGDDLPPPFEEAARVTFQQTRFSPGARQGQPVRVRIDIEVNFDDRVRDEVSPTALRPAAPANV